MKAELRRLIKQSAFDPEVPLAIAVCNHDGEVHEVVGGKWPTGQLVGPTDCFYAASLAKQVTGVAAAILVRAGLLDPDATIQSYFPELPTWAKDITARHLAHHTAGLPGAGLVEPAGADWTDRYASSALQGLPQLVSFPGAAYLYSNLGYFLLGQLISRAAGCSFVSFTEAHLFELDLPRFSGEALAQS